MRADHARSCGCQWKSSLVFASCSATQSWMLSLASVSCSTTQSWMLSLVSLSCFVTHSQMLIHYYEFPTSCPNSHLVVRLYQFIITVPVAILCTLLHRENTSFEVWYFTLFGTISQTSQQSTPVITFPVAHLDEWRLWRVTDATRRHPAHGAPRRK